MDYKAMRLEYLLHVEAIAEAIVDELHDFDGDRDEEATRLVDESVDQDEYVINDELALHTLWFSNYPCAAIFNGTALGSNKRSTDQFPFAAFAADALEMDVTDKVKALLEGR